MGSGIYIIRNTINKKVYIGSAVNIKRRFNEHKSDLLKNKHNNIYLQRFVNKYGFDTLSFEVLEVVLDKEKLIKREQFYIDSYKFSELFNICKAAGSSLGIKRSEATKKKIGESKKGNTNCLGRKLSESTKKKISEGQKGNTYTLGYKHTIVSKNNMSEGQKGRKHSKTTKKKMSESLKGNTNALGYKHTEATKKKLRKSAKKKIVLIYKDGILIDKVLGTTVVAKKYNLYSSNISAACLGKIKQTGGYTMKYKL